MAGSVELLDVTLSQLPLLSVFTEVVNAGLPEPEVRFTCTAEVAGAPDEGAVTATADGLKLTVKELATVKVTGILIGNPADTPVYGVTTILPVYVPAWSCDESMVTVNVVGVVENVGLTDSQLEPVVVLAEAVNDCWLI